jgi:hypothetical protein
MSKPVTVFIQNKKANIVCKISIVMQKNKHCYSNSLVVRDNFFINPEKVIKLSKQFNYANSPTWPGRRTENLLTMHDSQVQEFAKFFAKKIADEVFFGITKFLIDIRFHINDVYANDDANQGWIHNDEVCLAGLVYLNLEETNLDTGTSIFEKKTKFDFARPDFKSRQDFNLNKTVSEEYLKDLKNNHSNFTEITRVGNKFNRLVAYDAMQWHRPNRYTLESGNERLSLLFFIDKYEYVVPSSLLSMSSNWVDA